MLIGANFGPGARSDSLTVIAGCDVAVSASLNCKPDLDLNYGLEAKSCYALTDRIERGREL